MFRRNVFCKILVAFAFLSFPFSSRAQAPGNPLPSWNDGVIKRKIIAFVTAAVNTGKGFIKEQDRIAVFDNDGTLIQEVPTIEYAFASEQVERIAKSDPAFRQKMLAYVAPLPDKKARPALEEDLFTRGMASRGGMTEDEFADAARVWLARARHPKLDRPYPELRYQPMMELLAYLRENKFQTWLCTGGTVEFIRAYAPTAYGIPPQQIIGSLLRLQTGAKAGKAILYRKPGVLRINDKEEKAIGIAYQIGKRPVFACGNIRSGGDIAMLRYTQGSFSPNLTLLVNHDDAEREFAYQEKDDASLKAASIFGFTVVSMKKEWKQIFPPVSASDEVHAENSAPLIGTNWFLTALDGKAIPLYRGTRFPYLQLVRGDKPDSGKSGGFAGVNRMFGAYETQRASLKFTGIGATKMAGPPVSMELETGFLHALEKTDNYSINGSVLELRSGDTVLARFSATQPTPTTGGVKTP